MRKRWFDAVGLAAALLVVGWAVPGGAPRLAGLALLVALFPALLLAAAGGRARRLAAAGLAVSLALPWSLVVLASSSGRPWSVTATALTLGAIVVAPMLWLAALHAREPRDETKRRHDAAR